MKNEYKSLVGNLKRKKSFKRRRRRWINNIKMRVQGILGKIVERNLLTWYVNCCEQGNETLVFVNCRKFLVQVSNS
jgi:hypothetical protein